MSKDQEITAMIIRVCLLTMALMVLPSTASLPNLERATLNVTVFPGAGRNTCPSTTTRELALDENSKKVDRLLQGTEIMRVQFYN